MRVLPAVAICLLVSCGVGVAEEFRGPPWFSAARCTRQASEAADKDLDDLTNWAAVYRSFRLYKQCDDGGTAEGWSDKIVILLTEHWPELAALSRLAQTHPEFERFVLRHVDITMSRDQMGIIIDNARNKCPAGTKKLCRRLEAQAKNAPADSAP